jgi:heme exporter protein C
MKKHWWKIFSLILLLYAVVAGFTIKVPELPIIHQTIRNLFFHVCMWFTMIVLMAVSFVNSIRYLSGFQIKHDLLSVEAARTGLVFGMLGILTGMLWARFTWGDFWVKDPQLNGAATGMLIYFAYFILRGSLEDEHKKARLSAVYNIFAFVLFIVFIGILPRLSEGSLHPGKDGSPGLDVGGLDNNMRLVFYPAIVGWILLGVWITNLRFRMRKLQEKLDENV